MRWLWVAILAVCLSACGLGTTSEVRVERSPATVYAALSQSNVSGLASLFPGMNVERTKPSEYEILYSIPADEGDDATILFALEPADSGKATIVRSKVDVPEITAEIDGQTKVLSAMRISSYIDTSLKNFAKTGSSAQMRKRLSDILGGVAISTNANYRKLAMKGGGGSAALRDILSGLDPDALADGGFANGGFGADNQGERVAHYEREGPRHDLDAPDLAAEDLTYDERALTSDW